MLQSVRKSPSRSTALEAMQRTTRSTMANDDLGLPEHEKHVVPRLIPAWRRFGRNIRFSGAPRESERSGEMAINNVRRKLAEGGGIARCGVRKALCVNQGEIKLFCGPRSPFSIRETLMLWIGTVPVRSAHPTPAPGFTIPGRHEYQSAWSSKSGKVTEKI